MKDHRYYELTPAQDVAYLQCKYSLFKRVINILPSVTINEKVDFELMTKAFNLLVKRNDCLRIKFFKKGFKVMQYFRNEVPEVERIPVYSFTSEAEQNAFIEQYRKKPIKYLKGTVVEPNFINTFDNRTMILFKVTHLVLDIYGIGIIFKDLLGIYEALKNGTELPPEPASYEQVIVKDNERKDDKETQEKHKEFFEEIFRNNPEPRHAGIHGPENEFWQKVSKTHHGMKILFIQNDTKDYRHVIDARTVERAIELCEKKGTSFVNLLFFTSVLTASRLNNNEKSLLPLALYNCRISKSEKTGGGTKAQSLGCYVNLDYDASFEENFKTFSDNQFKYSKHVSFVDRDYETLLHKCYKSSLFEIYYFIAYSFVPFEMPSNVEFNIHSNGKGALPAYVVQLFNPTTKEIIMAYDVQTKTTSEADVARYHAMYLKVLNQILDNPDINIADVEI